MSLAYLKTISFGKDATATLATVATHRPVATLTVARVATVAVAQSSGEIFDVDLGTGNDSEIHLDFWSNLIDRINWCDLLIHELCDIRGDDQARRDDLILTRQRTAPVNIDGDIRYLLDEIERVTPTPSPEPIRDCRDCDHHRGRDNNAIRYCVAPDSAAQRENALASVIVDCSIATRCRAFTPYAK